VSVVDAPMLSKSEAHPLVTLVTMSESDWLLHAAVEQVVVNQELRVGMMDVVDEFEVARAARPRGFKQLASEEVAI